MPDQADILAELEKLKTEATTKDAELIQARADLDAAKASLQSTAAELATVKADNEKLKASQTEFDKKVAAEVAKKGIRADALPAAPKASKTEVKFMARDEFLKLSAVDQNAFIREGGKLQD